MHPSTCVCTRTCLIVCYILRDRSFSIKMSQSKESSSSSVHRGIGGEWSAVDHVALVVSDIGRSLHFYTEVVGMKQIIRPDFDR